MREEPMEPYTTIKTDLPKRAKKRGNMNSEIPIEVFPQHRANNTEAMGESIIPTFVYSYSCAMFNLSDDIAEKTLAWARENIPESSLYVDADSGIDGYELVPHVTIKYGIHSNDNTEIEKLVKDYGPVTLQLNEVSKFDTNPDFDVIKIAITSPRLNKLNKIITDNTECTDDFDEYIPHATLAYVKKGSCDHLIGDTSFDKLLDEVYEIYFTTRNGEEYYIDL